MAVAVHETVTEADAVTRAVVASYAARRELVDELPLAGLLDGPEDAGDLRTVVCGRDRVVEIVVDGEAHPETLVPATWELDTRGWRVVVLVALHRLGEAHGALRGTPCRLQAWWWDGDAVVFDRPEIP